MILLIHLYINDNIDVPLDKKEVFGWENRIMDHIIKKLSGDNDCYYTEHEEGSNTIKTFRRLKREKYK